MLCCEIFRRPIGDIRCRIDAETQIYQKMDGQNKMTKNRMNIAVIPGDGIGKEVVP
jgi:isocitrate dehydrogenase